MNKIFGELYLRYLFRIKKISNKKYYTARCFLKNFNIFDHKILEDKDIIFRKYKLK